MSVWSASAIAEDAPSGLPDPSIATSLPPGIADPGGIRSALATKGITYGLNYTGEVFGNVSGGVEQSTHFTGLVEAYTSIDLQTLLGWRGLTFFASAYQIHGTSISGENLGSIAAVSNIEAYPSTRLFEMWFEQSLLDDKVTVRFGQVAVDSEFFAADGGGNFVNSTFGWTTISSDNIPVGGPIYPIATPGVRVSFDPNENLKLMAGIWNGDPVGHCADDLDPGQCNEHGLDFRLEDPPLLVIEGGYAYNRSGAGLPGTIKLGGWRHFGDFDDLRLNSTGGSLGLSGGDPFLHTGNHGLYMVLDQMIYRSPDAAQAISIFGRAAGSPSDRNQIDAYADAGVVFTGFVPSRPNDVFGAAFAYSGISDDASAFDRDSGSPVVRDYEAVLEISYQAEIVPGLILQPDFQYFWHPGGSVPDPADPDDAVENAAVLGVRTTVNY